MIFLQHTIIGDLEGPTIILRKHDYEALTTMAGSAKSPLHEQSLWLDFRFGAAGCSNTDGIVLVSGDTGGQKDWTDCDFLPFGITELKKTLATIKGQDDAGKTIVGCLAFVMTSSRTVCVVGLLAEVSFHKYSKSTARSKRVPTT